MSVPSPNRRRAVTLLAALPWPAVLFQFLAVLPRYDKMFREFGLKLDDFTAVLLNASAWVRAHFLIALAGALGLMAVSVFAAHTVQSVDLPRNRRAAVLLFVFGVPCLVFGLAWLGVLNTHRTLVEGMRK
jgi:type II secretory pathway component PulF